MADIYEKALKNAEKLKKAQLTAVANNKVTLPKAKTTSSSNKSSKSGTKSTASGNTLSAKRLKNKQRATEHTTATTLQSKRNSQTNKSRLSKSAKEKQQAALPKNSKTVKGITTELKKNIAWDAREIKSNFLPKAEKEAAQRQIREERSNYYKDGAKSSPTAQLFTGVGAGLLDSTVGLPYAIAKGKKLSESKYFDDGSLDPTTEEGIAARNTGEIVGDIASYAMGYGAAGKATAKTAGKILATNAGKKATAKAVASKAGQKIGEETTKKVLQSATKNLVADSTVGAVMDLGQGRGEGLEGSDLAKYMGKSALLNLGIGGAMEAAPAVLKALENTKLGRSVAEGAGRNVDNVAKATTDTAPVQKAAENGKQRLKTPTNSKQQLKAKQKAARIAKARERQAKEAQAWQTAKEVGGYIDTVQATNKKAAKRTGKGIETLKEDKGFNAYMADTYGDIYAIENRAKKSGKTLNQFIKEEYDNYRFAPDDIKNNYAQSDISIKDLNAKKGEIAENERNQFAWYLQKKYGPLSNAQAAARKKNMDLQDFFRAEKAEFDKAKANAASAPRTKETPKAENKSGISIKETASPKVGDLTPEAKAKIYKAVEDRSGAKVVEEELPDGVDGFYQDGVIHININAANPQYTVLKHELTHHLQSSDMYEDFSKFIFGGLQEQGADLATLRAAKKSQYSGMLGRELSDSAVDEELIADFCGEYLFNSEKSIERLARENPNLFVRIYEWIVDTIKKLGADDETKFLIDAQRKYEKALRTAKADVTGEAYPLFVRATDDEIRAAEALEKAGATPEQIKQQTNLHRGFKDDWLYEIDDSKASINYDAYKNGNEVAPLKEGLNHPELWERVNADDYNLRITSPQKIAGREKSAAAYYDRINKEIAIPNKKGFSHGTAEEAMHEMQHFIQDTQDLPFGSSVNSYMKKIETPDVEEAEEVFCEKVEDLFDALKEKYGSRFEDLIDRSGDNGFQSYADAVDQIDLYMDPEVIPYDIMDKYADVLQAGMALNEPDLHKYYKARNMYLNTAGEIEARDAEKRINMTAEERRNTMPATKNENTVFAEDYYSTGGSVFHDDKLRKASESLYGEKGNKYKVKAETPSEGVKTASKPLPAKGQKKAEPVKVKTGNTGKPLPKKEASKVEVKGAKSVSADVKRPEMTYEEAVKAYGAYKNGIPKSIEIGDISKAADTIYGSELTSDKTAEAMRESLSSYVKVTKSNKTTIANANARIDDLGFNGALKKFNDTLKSGKRFNEEDIAMGAELYGALNAKGKTNQALDIAEDVIEMLSQTGRTFQAARIFASLTPYGRMRSIKIAAERMSERYGKNITVDDDLMKKLFEATDETEIDKIKRQIFTKLWNQVPAGFFEKLDAIRYTAMLSSPKTHLRNIFGNGAMFIGKEISDAVQTGLEKSVFKGKMDRLGADSTKAILNPFSKSDKELLSKAGELFDEVKDSILNSSSKYIEKSGRRPQDSRVFKRKTLEGARRLVSGTLEKEDEIAMRIAFKNAFAKMCKANGLEVGELTAKEIRQYTAYATRQAQQATFRDPNALASALNKVYNYALDTSKSDFAGKIGKGALKVGMDATVPFIRTPANVLKQGWRYSPGGLIEGIGRCATAKSADDLMRGIEILSNGVVGTPVVLIGAYLASKGYVTGNVGDYSDKTAKFKRMTGEQDYSLMVDGKSITLDWLSPYSMPFFVGVALGEDYPESESLSATQLVDALASVTNPFLEMSMMSGVQDLLTQSYDENAAQTIAFNTLSSYLTQYVPTVVSQIAKTVAETTTTTSSVNDGTITGRFISSTGAKLKGKVPGLYSSNQPDVDVWGRTETKEDMWDYIDAGLRNIISPANIKDMNLTDVDKELLKVYDALDDEKSAVIPTPAESKISYNKVDYQMTNEEFTAYKKDLGKYRYEKLQQLIKTSDYKMSNTKEKSKKIQAVYDEATTEAKKNYLINSGKMTKEEYALSTLGGENENKKLKAAINAGKIKATEVYDAKNLIKESGASSGAAEAYVLANSGMSSSKVALLTSDGSYEKAKDLKKAGATEKDVIKASQTLAGHGNDKAVRQAYMLLASGQSKAVTSALTSDTAINRAYAIRRANITPDQLDTVAKKIDTDNSGTYTNKELTAYLSGANMTRAQKYAVFEALKSSSKTANPY